MYDVCTRNSGLDGIHLTDEWEAFDMSMYKSAGTFRTIFCTIYCTAGPLMERRGIRAYFRMPLNEVTESTIEFWDCDVKRSPMDNTYIAIQLR